MSHTWGFRIAYYVDLDWAPNPRTREAYSLAFFCQLFLNPFN
ncbi:MAG: hypothetical protein NDF56_02555 [archaeon GB-1845-036]|nr:hypothetical protein [Candidatus Culexmicrobium thermophilum]